jgi:hypothetical protein
MDQNRSRPEAPSKDPKPASVGESLARGKEAIGAAASEAMTAASSDLHAIRNDLNSLKDTLAKFMAQASHEAAKSAREDSSSVTGQMKDAVGDAGDVADALADKGSQSRLHRRRTGEDPGRGDRSDGPPQSPRRAGRRGRHRLLIGVWGRRS